MGLVPWSPIGYFAVLPPYQIGYRNVVGAHRVEPAQRVARIALLQSQSPQTGLADAGEPGGLSAPDADHDPQGTLLALSHIGTEVQVLVADDVSECIALARRDDVDLAILDRCDSGAAATFFEAQSTLAAPTVVVISETAPESAALDAFRLGAADCVRAAEDYGEVLPLVAMEQIHRWRHHRDREAARSRIEWLEDLNQAIVSEIPVALAVLDEAACILEVNPEFCHAFGCTPEMARTRRLDDVLPSDLMERGDLARWLSPGAEAMTAAPRLVRTTDGEGRDRVFDIRRRRLGKGGDVLLTLSDVSEAELLSRRVGELERFSEHILRSIDSALVVLDLDGRITYANPMAGQLLGRPEEELQGQPGELFFSAPDGPSQLIARVLQEGVGAPGGEMMLALAEGQRVPIGISCTPLLAEDGNVMGAVAIFQDLSQIKELQRQVLQREKMASIGQLAAGVAHEINNPVGFIHANLAQMAEYLGDLSGYLDAVADLERAISSGESTGVGQAARALKESGQEIDVDYLRKDFSSALRESLEGSERIRHIVSDLRDFSHQGGLEMDLADVNQCVDSTANIVLTMMKHSVELRKDYADLPELRCHSMQLKQVFMNLLVNAYQAIEEDTAEGSGQGGIIEISTCQRDGGIEIAISDTGPGIADADLARIFDPFYTTKEVGAGTGLGLSTSYGIVKQHGGEMTATSEAGQGARFTVWLPNERAS